MEKEIRANLKYELTKTLKSKIKGRIKEEEVLPKITALVPRIIGNSGSNPLPVFFQDQLKGYQILSFTLQYETSFQSQYKGGNAYGQKGTFFFAAIKEFENLIAAFAYSEARHVITQHRKIAQAIKQAADDSFSKSLHYLLKGTDRKWDWEIYEFHCSLQDNKREVQLEELQREGKILYQDVKTGL